MSCALSLLTLACCCWSVSVTSSESARVVETRAGSVRGWERRSRSGRIYQGFTKIPYAQPPVGKLRFQAPRTVRRWEGVLDATQDAPQCLQPSGGSEDCLYLNVYRPRINKKNLPVVFYMHGGAFLLGGTGPRENADYLMDVDVILVSAAYRLGPLGFMALGDRTMPGNFGLKDVVMALRWVNRNIAAFGGNPGSVTLIGESAGGSGVHFLLKSPASAGYTSRAVSLSGTINHAYALLDKDYVRKYTLRIAEAVNCEASSSTEVIVQCLRRAKAEDLVNLANKAVFSNLNFAHFIAFGPVIEPRDAEDAVITTDLSLVPSGKPWMTSTTTGEYLLFKSVIDMATSNQVILDFKGNLRESLEKFVANFTSNSDKIRQGAQMLQRRYFPDGNQQSTDDFIQNLSQMQMDEFFVYPEIINANAHRGRTWISHFEHKGEVPTINPSTQQPYPDNVPGHAGEIYYYFNMRSLFPNLGPQQTQDDFSVSRRMIQRLENFANYGNPNGARGSSSEWPPYSRNEIFRITTDRDFLGDGSFYQPFEDTAKFWYNVIGWQ